ncbi:MAG: efflux RND transporter permease subunit [Planctomycetaceae bacterium]
MKDFIRDAIRNTPAMNTLALSLIVLGALSVWSMRREVFPEFSLERILVTVPYPGATPDEVEEGICQKLEESVRSIDGIKKQVSIAQEGSGSLSLELEKSADPQKVLADVRAEVDRIDTFPVLAEDSEVKQVTLREPAIQVGVIGPDIHTASAELELREVAEQVRDDLLLLPAVSQANLSGAKEFEIDIEIREETLRQYGLTLQQVSQIIRRENLDLPGGTIRSSSQDVLVRGKNKRVLGEEIANIPVLTQPDGAVIRVRDLGEVRDEFADLTSFTRIDGHPAAAISVDRTTTEDLIAMTDAVLNYVHEKQLPPGYRLVTWGDRSLEVRDRLDLLIENGLQGLALVLVTLGLFLSPRLAMWVAVGIPISILGACAILYLGGQTMNMLTSFTFVMALGIVVDDAIVIGENIHTHRQAGKPPLQSAIDGTLEVCGSVFSSVLTTVIAFLPLMFVSGVMGKFIAVMPFAMIATLAVSLFEATFVLPCHLAHESPPMSLSQRLRGVLTQMPAFARYTLGWPVAGIVLVVWELLYPLRKLISLMEWLGKPATRSLDFIAERIYTPVLRYCLQHPVFTVSCCTTLLMLTAGLMAGGKVPFVIFPKVDSNTIQAVVQFPDGTPPSVTDDATLRMEQAIQSIAARHAEQGEPIVELVRRSVGNATMRAGPGTETAVLAHHLGTLTVELVDAAERTTVSEDIVAEWRAAAGAFPGAESVTFGNRQNGPGGTPIEFKLLAPREQMQQLEAAVEKAKAKLDSYPGIFDISDDSGPGKWEFQIRVKDAAIAMGVPLAEVAETVRASYYGEEVMRLQRGRHEVKLMVRYPRDERRSLASFEQIRVRAADGAERPVTELADITVARGYSEINRVDQMRSVTISADVDEAQANAYQIVSDLKTKFMPALQKESPNVLVRWEGQQEQTTESVQSLIVGLLVALVGMFILLTLQFTSYFQPFLIMAIIPFGLSGAVWGHALLGMPLTLFSMFGMVTLTGIVVNDSIVLIDFINQRVRDGVPVRTALTESGVRRLRPIFLTSVTTIAGLLPLAFEQSFQAQILIPMAITICFGLAASTGLCLVLVPTFYLIHHRLTSFFVHEEQPESEFAPGHLPHQPVGVS